MIDTPEHCKALRGLLVPVNPNPVRDRRAMLCPGEVVSIAQNVTAQTPCLLIKAENKTKDSRVRNRIAVICSPQILGKEFITMPTALLAYDNLPLMEGQRRRPPSGRSPRSVRQSR